MKKVYSSCGRNFITYHNTAAKKNKDLDHNRQDDANNLEGPQCSDVIQ